MKISIILGTRPGIMKMPKTISQRGVHFIVKAFITTMMEIMDKELGGNN